MINILLALRERETTGRGRRFDVAMADNLFTFMYWALGNGLAARRMAAPRWRAGHGRLAALSDLPHAGRPVSRRGPLEQKFWENFCAAIGSGRNGATMRRDPQRTRAAVAGCVASRSSAAWREAFRRQGRLLRRRRQRRRSARRSAFCRARLVRAAARCRRPRDCGAAGAGRCQRSAVRRQRWAIRRWAQTTR